MASIRKELKLSIPPEAAWDALRDVGAVHRRVAPGFVTDCRMDAADRIVTFANGLSARELIVDVDDDARRLAYSARSERLTHHNASIQVSADGDGCRIVWITDVLPHEAGARAGKMMDAGIAAMRKTLEPHSRPA
ncbi:MAG TPA: SRPBCC family protein [Burkholderiales bacterium]|nr:SRPBCC family protein [Burkholderiales bacterium]